MLFFDHQRHCYSIPCFPDRRSLRQPSVPFLLCSRLRSMVDTDQSSKGSKHINFSCHECACPVEITRWKLLSLLFHPRQSQTLMTRQQSQKRLEFFQVGEVERSLRLYRGFCKRQALISRSLQKTGHCRVHNFEVSQGKKASLCLTR